MPLERHRDRAAALSRAIRGLEARLGVTLLERTTRRVALTAAGAALAEEARGVVAAAEAAGRRARRAAEVRERIVVAAKADGDGGLLGPILTAYASEDAAVEADVLLGGWGSRPSRSATGAPTWACCTYPSTERARPRGAGLQGAAAGRAARASPARERRRPLTLAQLAGEPLPR